MFAHFKRTITAGVLVAATAAGGFAPAPDTTPTPQFGAATASAATAHKFQYINQDQGQGTEWMDCGPATILMALLQNGGNLPDSYTAESQAQAMTGIRGNLSGYLQTPDMINILNARGVSGTQYVGANATNAIQDIKDGKSAIVLTTTGVIANEKARPGYGHYVYISGYNSETQTFTVNDPLKVEEASYQATEQQLTNIITQSAEGNTPWVYTM